jgi:uncharacterized membrane protein
MSSIATMYYERDLQMNLKPENQIKQSLEKLKYLNANYELMRKDFIKNKLTAKLSLDDLDTSLTINELIKQIEDNTEYLSYCQYLDNSKKRGSELEKFLISNDVKDFYNSCTEEELAYLGY